MCGIVGCVVPQGAEPDRQRLARALAEVGHRGPDDHGVEILGSVGLAHARLAIVDPGPAGHQPMADAGGRWWLTYNGEVFNHLALRARLPAVAWRGGSDSETLVEALAGWGEGAVPLCNGLFAFAALDLARRRLLLVRDRFGVKPLYYARHEGALWFASEIRALLAAGTPRRAEPGLLAHALATGWANGGRTPVEGVGRLLPGTLMTVELDTLATRERRWYDPLEHVDPDRAVPLDRAKARAAVEDALRASVRRRLMADVPLGTMCSGGVDSSLLTAFAAEEQPGLHAFNAAIADQPENDESAFAAAAAEAAGAELHTVEVTAASWRRDLVEVVRHVEYPLTHPSSVPMAQIARAAHERGIKVLLSGEGADELFGGYPWLNLPEHGDFLARRRPHERVLRPLYRRLQRAGLVGSPPPWPLPGPSEEVATFEREAVARAEAAYAHHDGRRRSLEAAFASYLDLYLPHLLNRQDKTTMQWSVETRVPFLDPEVVALAMNLPLELKLEPARKELLRELARRHLPSGGWERRKVGFALDAAAYIEPAARPEFLGSGRLREVLAQPEERWRERIAGLDPHGKLLHWTGEVWCRTILDGEPADVVEEALWREPGS